MSNLPSIDAESLALDKLMSACAALLAAQESAQPDRMPDIRKALASAESLRVEAEIQRATKFVAVRLVTLDGAGAELAVLRALDARPVRAQ